jgi:hypothetical protein
MKRLRVDGVYRMVKLAGEIWPSDKRRCGRLFILHLEPTNEVRLLQSKSRLSIAHAGADAH